MSSVSVRAYFGESRRCGVGFSFGVDRFSMRALAFGGPAPFDVRLLHETPIGILSGTLGLPRGGAAVIVVMLPVFGRMV